MSGGDVRLPIDNTSKGDQDQEHKGSSISDSKAKTGGHGGYSPCSLFTLLFVRTEQGPHSCLLDVQTVSNNPKGLRVVGNCLYIQQTTVWTLFSAYEEKSSNSPLRMFLKTKIIPQYYTRHA